MSVTDDLTDDDKDVLLLLSTTNERVKISYVVDVLPQLDDTRQAHYRVNKLCNLGLAKKIKKGDRQLDPVTVTTSDLGDDVADTINDSHETIREEIHNLRRQNKELLESFARLKQEYENVADELNAVRTRQDEFREGINGIQRYLNDRENGR